jgi:urea carboxylase
VATPVDPRHRLVTTKYIPARSLTPPYVVGMGGAYLCIYGMEGPGGYQLFGRTLQVWNTWRQTDAFADGKPWLLRFFDRIKFHPVSHTELTEARRDFLHGRYDLRIDEETFRLADYRRFLAENADAIDQFQQTRQGAFDAERADWEARGEFARVAALVDDGAGGGETQAIVAPDGCELIEAPLGGSMWKVGVRAGDTIAAGDIIAVIEAMKAECDVPSPSAGVVREVYAREKDAIAAGAPIIALETLW